MKLSVATPEHVHAVFQESASIIGRRAVDGVAQEFTDLLYQRFEDSLVLTRLFATVPMGKLPESNRDFVTELAASTGISDQIDDGTIILSLLGTSGVLPEWNDRRNSRGHVGIPLVSGAFVESIPMIARLLKEIGMNLDWIDDWDTKIISKGFLSQSTGMFYVSDAKTAEDGSKRKIIAAQDFVAEYDIKTVFGYGCACGLPTAGTLVVLIAFARETLAPSLVRSCITIMQGFKRAATEYVLRGEFFE